MRLIFTVLLAISLAVLIACNSSAAPTKIEPIAKTTPTAVRPAADTHDHSADENAPRISLEDAKKAFDAGEAVFVDTRYADAFALERIKGAINVPANEFDTAYTKVPKGKKIIAYCS